MSQENGYENLLRWPKPKNVIRKDTKYLITEKLEGTRIWVSSKDIGYFDEKGFAYKFPPNNCYTPLVNELRIQSRLPKNVVAYCIVLGGNSNKKKYGTGDSVGKMDLVVTYLTKENKFMSGIEMCEELQRRTLPMPPIICKPYLHEGEESLKELLYRKPQMSYKHRKELFEGYVLIPYVMGHYTKMFYVEL